MFKTISHSFLNTSKCLIFISKIAAKISGVFILIASVFRADGLQWCYFSSSLAETHWKEKSPISQLLERKITCFIAASRTSEEKPFANRKQRWAGASHAFVQSTKCPSQIWGTTTWQLSWNYAWPTFSILSRDALFITSGYYQHCDACNKVLCAYQYLMNWLCVKSQSKMFLVISLKSLQPFKIRTLTS